MLFFWKRRLDNVICNFLKLFDNVFLSKRLDNVIFWKRRLDNVIFLKRMLHNIIKN